MSAQLFFVPLNAVLYRGLPQAGATATFYLAGTTTKTSVYSSNTLTTLLSNPVVADGTGVLPSIYLDSTILYRVIIKDILGDVIVDVNNYIPGTYVSYQGADGVNGGTSSNLTIGLFTGAAGQDLTAGGTKPAPETVFTSGYNTIGLGAAQYVKDAAVDAAFVTAHPGWSFRDSQGNGYRLSLDHDMTFEMLGAKGDGSTNDASAINAASAAAVAQGRTKICGTAGKVYRIASPILPRQNLIWDFCGSAISAATGRMIQDQSDTTKTLIGTVSADIVGPTDVVPYTGTGVAVGDWVALRLGDNAWDVAEPRYAVAAKVLAVTAGVSFQIDWIIPHSITISTAASGNKTIYKLVTADIPMNLKFVNGELRGDHVNPGVEMGFDLKWGNNLRFRMDANLDGSGDMGAGLIVLQYCRGVVVDSPTINSSRNARGQSSMGRALSFSNCIDVEVSDLNVRNCEGDAVFIESYCEKITLEPSVQMATAVVRKSTINGSPYMLPPIFVGQGSECDIHSPRITTDGNVASLTDSGGTPNSVQIFGRYRWRGPMPLAFWSIRQMFGVLDWKNGTDFVVVDYVNTSRFALTIDIAASGTYDTIVPGPIIEFGIAASSGVVVAGIGTIYHGHVGNNGSVVTIALQAGKMVRAPEVGGAGNNYLGVDHLNRPGKILTTTDATVQGSGAFLAITGTCATVVSSSQTYLGNGGVFSATDAQLKKLAAGHVY